MRCIEPVGGFWAKLITNRVDGTKYVRPELKNAPVAVKKSPREVTRKVLSWSNHREG